MPASYTDIDYIQPQGPWLKAPNGNFYLVARDASTTTDLKCLKTADPLATTPTEQDATNRHTATNAISSFHARLVGSVIECITLESDQDAEYSEFDTSTDSWGTLSEAANAFSGGLIQWVYACGARPDGDVLISFHDREKVMGTDYQRSHLSRLEAGTWTPFINVSAAGSVERHFRYPVGITTSNSRTHVAYVDSGNGLLFSTYLGGNTFGHQDTTLDASADTSGQAEFIDVVQFDDGGTLKVRWLYKRSGNLYIVGFNGDADSPTPITPIGPINAAGSVTSAALAVDTSGASPVQHVLFVDDVDGTILRHAETGAGDDNWGTPANELDSASAVTVFSAACYANGGQVLGYLYTDGGAGTYNERTLGAGTTTAIGAQTLEELAQAGTGALQPSAEGVQLFPGVAQAGVGTQKFIATGDSNLSLLAQAAVGVMHPEGQGAQVVSELSQTANVKASIPGAGAHVLAEVSQATVVDEGIPGAGASNWSALMQDAQGVMHPEGAGGQTLQDLAQVATGDVIEPVDGAGASFLQMIVQDGVAAQIFVGNADQNVDTVSQASAVLESIPGQGSGTFVDLSQSGSIFEELIGSGTNVLELLSQAADVVMQPSGDGASVLSALTQAGVAVELFIAQSTQVLVDLSQAAEGRVPIVGDGQQIISAVTQDASVLLSVPGQSDQSVVPVSQLAEAFMTPVGDGAQQLQDLQQVALGVAGDVEGSASQTIVQISQTSQGIMAPEGLGDQSFVLMSQDGTVSEFIIGEGSQQFLVVVQDGVALLVPAGLSAQTLAFLSQDSAGLESIFGTAAQTLAEIVQESISVPDPQIITVEVSGTWGLNTTNGLWGIQGITGIFGDHSSS